MCVCVCSSICLLLQVCVFPGALCLCASDTISSPFSLVIWIRTCINFVRVRGENAEPVNKPLLLLPTIRCQVHTSSQHIIINCTLNYSVQLAMREWMERGRRRWNRWLHGRLLQNVIPIIVKTISAWFCIFAQDVFDLLMHAPHLCGCLYIIESSPLSIYCMFVKVISCINKKHVKIPLALQWCSNEKCAHARRWRPGSFTFPCQSQYAHIWKEISL